MTPHGHHSASRLDLSPTTQPPSAAMPSVTPSSEVNAVGQPVPAQQVVSPAASVLAEVAQRLDSEHATPAVTSDRTEARAEGAVPGSSGAASEADLVTPPGVFQPGQVWLNNVFSPEIPERPRYGA